MEKEKTNLSNGRLLSIDALRGFDMLFIMGISESSSASVRSFLAERVVGSRVRWGT